MISPEIRILFAFLVAYFSALFVIPKIVRIARAIGLIDRPGHRKVHTIPRPLVGGIGIVIAATFSCLLLVPLAGYRGLFLGLALLLLVGFLDDFRELDHRRKFLAQIAASILAIYFSDVRLVSFGDLLGFGPIRLPDTPVLIWLVTIFCIVGVVNSVNLIDGLDGLAGGISFLAFLTFGLHASFADQQVLMLVNLAFAGAILGFLRFNWHPSIVFMGDAGSLCLGFALAFMAVIMTQGEHPVMSPVVPLLVLAVPITDTVIVMGKRLLRGQSPFKPDRYHLHHIFMRYGMVRDTAVKAILGICMVLNTVTLLTQFHHVPDVVLFGIYLFYLTGFFVASFFIIYLFRFSLRYRRRRALMKRPERTELFVHTLLNGLDLMKIFRKDRRYPITLDIVCRVPGSNAVFSGEIINISNRGCMARLPGLNVLQNTVITEITFPLDDKVYVLPLPAEHLWVSENDGGCYHGFRFGEMEGNNKLVFQHFMMRFQKHFSFSEAIPQSEAA